MQKASSKQTAAVVVSLVLAAIFIKAIVGTDNSKSNTATVTQQEVPPKVAHKQDSKDYAAEVKSQLQADLKSADVHLADEGSLKWLFVTVTLDEWQSLNSQDKKDLTTLLIRHMKTKFPNNGLKVSIGINADQPLAEADWAQTSNGPNITVIGD